MTHAKLFHLRIRNLQTRNPTAPWLYRLREGSVLVGQDPACDIFLDDHTVSARHARIEYDADNQLYRVIDLQSANGTRLRGGLLPPNQPVPLRENATFQIGVYEFVFEEHRADDVGAAQEATTPRQERTIIFDPYAGEIPPGLSLYSLRLLQYLPEIYRSSESLFVSSVANGPIDANQATFLSRFLALFESVLLPIESVITNFSFYLDARAAPFEFLPWLEYWYGLPLSENLNEEQRRQVLLAAHTLFEQKGSAAALKQAIYCCTGIRPEIDDQTTVGASFIVKIKAAPHQVDEQLLHHLIVAFKPVDTTYELHISDEPQMG